jgi:hypothetical protein
MVKFGQLLVMRRSLLVSRLQKNTCALIFENHLETAAYSAEPEQVIWHKRFGYVAESTWVEIAKSDAVIWLAQKLADSEKQKIMDCSSRILGKMKKIPYKSSYQACKKPMDRWHMDVTELEQGCFFEWKSICCASRRLW